MFGKNTTHETIRIARADSIPATANIARHADRLKSLTVVSKGGCFGRAWINPGLPANGHGDRNPMVSTIFRVSGEQLTG